ncbi:multiheme c-type cytochrome [Nannocystis sp. SCPEA4]|uniref:multiheme c-type cytochrome n=1 Tax=Nannocystis sp. SCPEA4 TaxID=2996787 RepID=UPI00227043F0|nr:multiheme c-type cytochrome [Nannocystis sp. SCPEA4]MCY1055686.1 multiheme c-type cytochrome [Nannocystis sp. SCPEA4]
MFGSAGRGVRAATATCAWSLALLGCAGAPASEAPRAVARAGASVSPAAAPTPGPGEVPAALLPDNRGPFFPSLTQVAGTIAGADLADTTACASCHTEIAAQWQASAHAFASFNNPIYRASIERFRSARGNETSRFCGGCHDPSLLVDGALDVAVAARDPRAHSGVTCRTCHQAEHATFDGNGSYRLAATLLTGPDPESPASVAAHKVAARPATLATAQLCGSCHRAFLSEATGQPHYLQGTDDNGPWLHSVYAGSAVMRVDDEVSERTCSSCHMPSERATRPDPAADAAGMVRSHRFLGGHTWLAAIRGDEDTTARVQAFLRGVVSVDVAAATILPLGTGAPGEGLGEHAPADAAPLRAGQRVVFDVVVRNESVGHHFPGGTRDAQDTLVELQLLGNSGELLAAPAEPHRLGSAMLDEHGVPQWAREIEDLRAVGYDHTIAPRDARVVRFAVDVPEDMTDWPIKAVARVLHRSRTEALREVTCAEGRSREGKAFAAITAKWTGEHIDACAPQPVTELARAEVWLGAGAPVSTDSQRDARRLYVRGLGLLHEVQEQVGRAGASFESALALADPGDPRLRAAIVSGLAAVAGQQGRAEAAASLADEAAALLPGHPAPAWLKGQAYSAVWRWEQAIAPLRSAAEAAPKDALAHAALALALGSAGRASEALATAQRGLASGARRNYDLLRLQALALADLGGADVQAAMAAQLDHRPNDDAPNWRAACQEASPACARERVPVHTHALVWR